MLYKYMHIYLWTALRIVVFERGIYGFCTEGFEVEIFLFLGTGLRGYSQEKSAL